MHMKRDKYSINRSILKTTNSAEVIITFDITKRRLINS